MIGKPRGPKSGGFGPSGPTGVYAYAHRRLYEHHTRTWYSSGADAASQLTTDLISASELSVAISC